MYTTNYKTISSSADRMAELLEIIPDKLHKFSVEDFRRKPGTDKWSKQETLGHLLDSASNNHQRFIRSQYEEVPKITYAQNDWVNYGMHNRIEKSQLINFWTDYNAYILTLIRLMPKENFARTCNSGDEQPRTIEYLFIDYVAHMEHHLKQIVDY